MCILSGMQEEKSSLGKNYYNLSEVWALDNNNISPVVH